MAAQLPEHVADIILGFPEYRMGAHKVAVELRDGTIVDDVLVAWGGEVIRVGGVDGCSFDPSAVVNAYDRSSA
jgi:hypothetical protein